MQPHVSDPRTNDHEVITLEEPLMRTSDVAELLRVSTRTVTGWARSGRIPSVRMPGGHWRFRRDALRALLAQGEDIN